MNKKEAFTLVELIAVIALLGVLITVVSTNIVGKVKDVNTRLDATVESMFISSFEDYVQDNIRNYQYNSGSHCVSFDTIISSGYLSNDTFNSQNRLELENSYFILKTDNNKLEYEIDYQNICSSMARVDSTTHIINNTWEELKEISTRIAADSSVTFTSTTAYGLTVGDKITIDGLTCYIAGFNHDVDNGETGITLVANSGKLHGMNPAGNGHTFGHNVGGWNSSDMRTYVKSSEFTDSIPTIVDAAKLVKKISDTGGESVAKFIPDTNEEKDYLWLLSYEEVFPTDYANYTSDKDYVVLGQGSCYPIFTAEDSSRTQISSSGWWLRSARTSNSVGFWAIISSGGSAHNRAFGLAGVVFGFCI